MMNDVDIKRAAEEMARRHSDFLHLPLELRWEELARVAFAAVHPDLTSFTDDEISTEWLSRLPPVEVTPELHEKMRQAARRGLAKLDLQRSIRAAAATAEWDELEKLIDIAFDFNAAPGAVRDVPTAGALLEVAWGIICNAGEGAWERESKEWQDAAARFRADYFAHIGIPAAAPSSPETPSDA